MTCGKNKIYHYLTNNNNNNNNNNRICIAPVCAKRLQWHYLTSYRRNHRAMRSKFRYLSKFTATSHVFHCDSNAFKLNNNINHRKNNGVKYIYLLPLNSLPDSHCLPHKHQWPFKMLKLYIVRPLCTVKCSAFLSSFGTNITFHLALFLIRHV